ncbi:MAG: NAD(P)H-hydrate epimerase [Candidatus Omnitrophica bacterium]|nr:NAD(P)H-hydrate epimerase [Candidatus Omnitrophota bacterium]MCF7891666.1 NAD(P)H-hydrate epimerase [Candidatus Omnitrophota bacterium]MCF7897287.1 NAD(P)H-hydrate epimerase [Candidatus Omnitrophota bacterium]MCF7909322.1 NAD(P)H-hydrate epimerase [Candidatus Omnitrophota bacterium]
MKNITADQMKRIDKTAIEEFGIPSLILMENAGRGAADIAYNMLLDKRSKVVCVCGKGNNGGDGFVCARHLINKGINILTFLTCKRDQLKGDAKINFSILEKMNASVYELAKKDDFKNLENEIINSELVIDAIFGIGITGNIREPYFQSIQTINENKKKVLAIDLPSGLDATEGNVLGACVKADKTATFAAVKTGLVKNQGPGFCGEVIVVDISIPKQLLGK